MSVFVTLQIKHLNASIRLNPKINKEKEEGCSQGNWKEYETGACQFHIQLTPYSLYIHAISNCSFTNSFSIFISLFAVCLRSRTKITMRRNFNSNIGCGSVAFHHRCFIGAPFALAKVLELQMSRHLAKQRVQQRTERAFSRTSLSQWDRDIHSGWTA